MLHVGLGPGRAGEKRWSEEDTGISEICNGGEGKPGSRSMQTESPTTGVRARKGRKRE